MESSKQLIKSRKQQFLKQSIIDSNYNLDDFLKYSMQLKENGDDIDNWTESELEKVVENYRELPDTFFGIKNTCMMNASYKIVEFTHLGKDKFCVKVKQSANPVFRNLSDINWVFKAAQNEHKYVFILPLPEFTLCQKSAMKFFQMKKLILFGFF